MPPTDPARFGRRGRTVAFGSMLLATGLLFAGCTSGGNSNAIREQQSSTSPTAPSPLGTPSGPASETGSPTGGDTGSPTGGDTASGASGQQASPDAKKEITHAYQAFFSPDTSQRQTVAALQDGEKFADVIAQQGQGANSSLASKASAKVSDITLVSPDVAKLRYTVYVGDKAMLPDQPGYAVKQDGHWKMAAYTFCGLMRLEMGDQAPDACAAPEATAPPDQQ